MTGLERVGEALQGRFADRRALAPLLSLYGARLSGFKPESYFRAPELYLRGQLAVAERFDPDLLFGPFALALEAEAYGAPLAWPAESPPTVKKPAFPSLGSALAAFEAGPPDPLRSPALGALVESVRLLSARFKDEKPIAAIVTAPCDLPALLIGIEAWLETLLWKPAEAALLAEAAARHFRALVSAYFAAGASLVVFPVMFANARILTEALVKGWALPLLERSFEALPGPLVFHHGANPLAERIELYAGLPGLAGFVMDEGDDLGRARGILGPERLLVGGVSGPLASRRGPAELGVRIRRILENRAADPRFILGSSAADLPWDTPAENIDAFREALECDAAQRRAAQGRAESLGRGLQGGGPRAPGD